MGRLSDDYWNDHHSQQVRKEVLQNDRDCMMTRAQSDSDLLNQGRFAKEAATEVTASKGAPTFPQIPGGPWSSDYAPATRDPDPLGFDINEVEPCGSTAEIERSLPQPTPNVSSTDAHPVAARVGQTEGGALAPSPLSVTNPHVAAASLHQVADAVAAVAGGVSLSSPATSRKRSFRRF